MPFFEVSCKDNINIEAAFLTLARKIREQREKRVCMVDDKIMIHEKNRLLHATRVAG